MNVDCTLSLSKGRHFAGNVGGGGSYLRAVARRGRSGVTAVLHYDGIDKVLVLTENAISISIPTMHSFDSSIHEVHSVSLPSDRRILRHSVAR